MGMKKENSERMFQTDGGDLPFHSIWYFRCRNRILWDRRRRLDELWVSGDTERIRRVALGEKVKGFDGVADQKLALETQAAIKQAADTMATMKRSGSSIWWSNRSSASGSKPRSNACSRIGNARHSLKSLEWRRNMLVC